MNDLESVLDGSYIDPRDTQGMINKHGCRFSSPPRDLSCIAVRIGDIQLGELIPTVKCKYKVYRSTFKHDEGKVSLMEIQ